MTDSDIIRLFFDRDEPSSLKAYVAVLLPQPKYAVIHNDIEGMQMGHLEYLIPIPGASVSYGESETPK